MKPRLENSTSFAVSRSRSKVDTLLYLALTFFFFNSKDDQVLVQLIKAPFYIVHIVSHVINIDDYVVFLMTSTYPL